MGGRNKVAMKDLKRLFEALGHGQVETYIQSGNIAFEAAGGATGSSRVKRSGGRADPDLEEQLEQAIATELGVACAVVVLGHDQLSSVVEGNPFPDYEDPRHLHAVFRSARTAPVDEKSLEAAVERARAKAPGQRDQVEVRGGRTLYLWTPDGYGRSELAAQLSRSATAQATARNWATVLKLMDLLDPSAA